MFSKLTRAKRIAVFGLLAAGLGLAAWGVSASRSPDIYTAPPAPGSADSGLAASLTTPDQATLLPMANAAPEASSGIEAAKPAAPLSDDGFRSDCVNPLRTERYAEAIDACQRYTNDEKLGAKAHAALAAIYSTRAYRDVTASVTHAERAAELGDPRGKFMTAIQMLAGYSPRPFDLVLIRKLLQDAQNNGVNQAGMLLERIAESEQCRKNKQTFLLLNAPVFCMFRPEVSQVLAARGMAQRNADPASWTDVWRPGDVLPAANQAELQFDRNPEDEMLRLAQFTYRIDPIAAADQLPLVAQALRQKYGPPARGANEPSRGSHTIWHTGSGIDITLANLTDGSVELRYAQPQRAAERDSHLTREDQLSRQARVRRQQIAL